MNYLNRFLSAIFLILVFLNFGSCRTSNDPNTTIPTGLRATINGTPWVADTAYAFINGTCLTVIGWTGSGGDGMLISIGGPSTLMSGDSCQQGGSYTVGSNPMPISKGSMFLAGKTSSSVQGTFAFRGVIFRDSDTTYITNGEFNLGMKN